MRWTTMLAIIQYDLSLLGTLMIIRTCTSPFAVTLEIDYQNSVIAHEFMTSLKRLWTLNVHHVELPNPAWFNNLDKRPSGPWLYIIAYIYALHGMWPCICRILEALCWWSQVCTKQWLPYMNKCLMWSSFKLGWWSIQTLWLPLVTSCSSRTIP